MAILLGGAVLFVQFIRAHYGEHSHEIVLQLDQWFKRCHLKKFTHDSDARQMKSDHNRAKNVAARGNDLSR